MAASRFPRPSDPSSSPSPAGAPGQVSDSADDLIARHRALSERGREMANRRMRREVELEGVVATDKTLSQQAEALGAKTPDALLKLIEAQEKADREALDLYEKALDAEEALLDSVERELLAAQGDVE